ncbi:MAG: T9SS type A sorting domain-containing protein [Crocinitomicaceae bacterium]|nr:T9SS type A sorting domain-containing protein [Crocinitomicaceae bacterium]
MRILITITLVVSATISFGQVSSFFKLYSDQGDDSGHGIVELLDSSYAVTGSSSSFIGGVGSQAFLLKIDSTGGFEWSKNYGGPESEVGRRIMHIDNIGYYIAGYTNSYGNGGYDYYLLKTDLSGNILWEKTYGDFGWERVHDAVLARDSGVIMIGETSSSFPENKDMWIVRTDQNGDTLWTMRLGDENGDDVLESIDQATDSTYYAAGYTYDPILDQTFAFSMHLHENGTVYWTDNMGADGDYYFHGITMDTANNELVAVGHHVPLGETRKDQFFARIGLAGAEIGWYTNPLARDQMNTMVTTYGIAGYRMIGLSKFDDSSVDEAEDVSLHMYTQALAHLTTVFSVNFPGQDDMGQVVPTQDGGTISTGRTNSQGDTIGVNHIFVAKVGMWNDSPSTIIPHDIQTVVSVEEDDMIEYLEVYPNPSNGIITLSSSLQDEVSVEIYSGLGALMSKMNMYGSITMDVSNYSAGIYYIKSTTKGGLRNVHKLVVKK